MPQTALVIIDIQNDYLPGGAFELAGAEAAAANARRLLDHFRATGQPVIHIRHESLRPGSTFFLPGTSGADIHPLVAPAPGEPVILKHFPNAFRDTTLQAELASRNVKSLVAAGMMTLMCVDATVRAAFDLGYAVTVAHDACAARPLRFGELDIPAEAVHGAFLAALGMVYAEIAATAEMVGKM
jgi:nicotinamidase-related amidase